MRDAVALARRTVRALTPIQPHGHCNPNTSNSGVCGRRNTANARNTICSERLSNTDCLHTGIEIAPHKTICIHVKLNIIVFVENQNYLCMCMLWAMVTNKGYPLSVSQNNDPLPPPVVCHKACPLVYHKS